MAAVTTPQTGPEAISTGAPPSPAGPAPAGAEIRGPQPLSESRIRQTLRFVRDSLAFNLDAHRRHGDVWELKLLSRPEPFAATAHPDHVKSLMTADPDLAPTVTGDSPLRPILGPNSVLTSIGPRHMRQRKLLLPPFHGEAVQRYVEMIAEVAEREIDSWPTGQPFALAPRMSAVTLDVIMGGVFGIGTQPERGSAEYRLKDTIRRGLRASAHPLFALVEFRNAGRREARGVLKAMLDYADREIYAVISERRARGSSDGHDILSMLLAARDEEGRELSDSELRDELMTLVLAGHETTANQLAWTFERLLRTPAAYDGLREAVRTGGALGEAYVEATIHESMRVRPVIPVIGRLVKVPWQLGEYVVPANTPVAISIAALHHRADVYPEPFEFRPERFLDKKPGTYTWIPFGGGIRRCLGATLAMAEQRTVLSAIARRTDLRAPDLRPERPHQRNVTMIPGRGGQVSVVRRVPV